MSLNDSNKKNGNNPHKFIKYLKKYRQLQKIDT